MRLCAIQQPYPYTPEEAPAAEEISAVEEAPATEETAEPAASEDKAE